MMDWRRQVTGEHQIPPGGDQFAELVPPLAPLLLRVAAALIGPSDAEDAAQEAILRAWQQRANLRDTGAVRPWLLQITVNICRQWQRGRFGTRRRRTVSLAEAELLSAPLLVGDLNAAEYTETLDLQQALKGLPEQLRLIVALRYFGDLDATEIGFVLQVPPATVRTRLRRALSILRTSLRMSGDLRSVKTEEGGKPAC
ncbi:MAG: RNA polymerase sigma factor [Ktedonobacterales bacterium]